MGWIPHLKVSPGTAGQGLQHQLFPTATQAMPAHQGMHSTSSGPAAGGQTLFLAVHGERTRGTKHKLKYRKLCINTEIKTFLSGRVVRCRNRLPGEAVECPCWEVFKNPWDVALSSLLQLSLLQPGGWTRRSPEVPVNPSPYGASVSLEETVATQGLPKYNCQIFVVCPHTR